MLQIIETSDKEKFEMYNLLPKETLIGMLIECNKQLQRRTPKIIMPNHCGFYTANETDSGARCIYCGKQKHKH